MRGQWRVTVGVDGNTHLDAVHRVIGRPGIVLVGEGAPHRVKGLIAQQKKRIARVVGQTPIYEVVVGNEEGQIPLGKLQRHLTKLPRNISPKDMESLEVRLAALGSRTDRSCPRARCRPAPRCAACSAPCAAAEPELSVPAATLAAWHAGSRMGGGQRWPCPQPTGSRSPFSRVERPGPSSSGPTLEVMPDCNVALGGRPGADPGFRDHRRARLRRCDPVRDPPRARRGDRLAVHPGLRPHHQTRAYAEAGILFLMLVEPTPPSAVLYELRGGEYAEVARSTDGRIELVRPFPVVLDLAPAPRR